MYIYFNELLSICLSRWVLFLWRILTDNTGVKKNSVILEALISVHHYFFLICIFPHHSKVGGGMYGGSVHWWFPYFLPLIWSHVLAMCLVLIPIPRVGGGGRFSRFQHVTDDRDGYHWQEQPNWGPSYNDSVKGTWKQFLGPYGQEGSTSPETIPGPWWWRC